MNKTIVITGASRGLGAGLARDFAGRGFALGLCARSETPFTPEQVPGGLVETRLDVTDAAAVADFTRSVAEQLGPIDLWINNAGVLEPIRQLRDVEADELRRHIDVNLIGVFNGSRSYVEHVRSRDGGGVLVNISSGAGRHPYSGWGAYCAAKAAVDRLTEVLALEEASSGLRAWAVAPGVIDTDMQALIRRSSADDFPMVERFRTMKEEDSFSTPAQVAEGLLRLCFPAEYGEAQRERVPGEGVPGEGVPGEGVPGEGVLVDLRSD